MAKTKPLDAAIAASNLGDKSTVTLDFSKSRDSFTVRIAGGIRYALTDSEAGHLITVTHTTRVRGVTVTKRADKELEQRKVAVPRDSWRSWEVLRKK